MNNDLEKELENKDIRPTAMRILVLQALMKHEYAMSLNDLEMEFENVDKSTLFRTLKTFEDKKLIHCINDGNGSVKYAICKATCLVEHIDKHVHFLCLKCNHTYCLTDFEIPSINLPVDFTFESANVIVNGVCANCK